MALDSVFLLECLQFYVTMHAHQSSDADVKQLGRVLHSTGNSAAHNSVLRDVMLLENKVPLFLLRKLLELQIGTKAEAEERLYSLVRFVCNKLSPFSFKLPDDSELNLNEIGAHVLEALYNFIVPDFDIQTPMPEEGDDASETVNMSTVTEASNLLWKTLSAINVRPIRFLKELPRRAVNQRPVQIVMGLPLRLLSLVNKDAIKSEEESSVKIIPPSRDELNIPSVADLYFAGAKFSPSDGDLTTIQFDEKSATLYLPKLMLDCNTEVILRNLVAFEASAAPGALVFRRYTDFMNGLINCENDVRLLSESGIISNQLKSDGEVASLWNSMGKCIRGTNVAYLEKIIKDLNRYYYRKWNVGVVEMVTKHIFGSWKFLSVVAASILLVLTCLQAYCSVYNCKSWLNQSSVKVEAHTRKFCCIWHSISVIQHCHFPLFSNTPVWSFSVCCSLIWVSTAFSAFLYLCISVVGIDQYADLAYLCSTLL